MTRERLKLIAKIALGALLITYVLRSQMIDFEALGGILFNPLNLLVAFAILTTSYCLISLRWFLLAKAQGLSLNFSTVFQLTMIGNFFNTFMPGSVGGDLVKAWYVAGRAPNQKTKAIFTVLLDRLMGLSVFFFAAALTLALNQDLLAEREKLRLLAYAVWGISGSMAIFVCFFYSPLYLKFRPFHALLDLFRKNSALKKIIDASLLYRDHRKAIFFGFLISCLSVTMTIILFLVQGRSLGIPLELSRYCFIVPIGLIVSAIPILPGGIGVGQVAFFTLFQWSASANPELGGTLCTIVQVYTLFFNATGAFFYFRFKRLPENQLPSQEAAVVQKRAKTA